MENYKEIYATVMGEYSAKRRNAEERAEQMRRSIASSSDEYARIIAELKKTPMKILEASRAGNAADRSGMIKKIRKETEGLNAKKSELLKTLGYPDGCDEVRYECEKCKDTGYLDDRMCDCLRKELAVRHLAASGLGRLCLTQNFTTFSLEYYKETPGQYAAMKKLLENAKTYALSFCGRGSGNLLLMGGTGLGKTHLCCAIAYEVAGSGYGVVYTGAGALTAVFADARYRNNDNSADDIGRYLDAELLIIDDLGTEAPNNFTVSCIFDVINSRLVSDLPTIINTNLGPDDILRVYGDRVYSRLFGEYSVLLFEGTDVRRQKLGKKNQ